MARVNVEEELFAGRKLAKAGRILGSTQAALGYLVFLWRDSQAELRVSGSKEEIIDWMRPITTEDGELAFKALLTAGLLIQTQDDEFEIVGNETQIAARVERLSNSQKGAEATKKKWEKIKSERTNHKVEVNNSKADSYATSPTTPGPTAMLPAFEMKAVTTPNSVQCSSVQFSSDQTNAVQCSPGQDSLLTQGPSPKDFVDLWNSNCETLPKVEKLSDKRRNRIKRLLHDEPDLAYWLEIIQRLVASDFCQGKNSNGWRADFDFLLQTDTHLKVSEGKYDNRQALGKSQHASKNQQIYDANKKLFEAVERGDA